MTRILSSNISVKTTVTPAPQTNVGGQAGRDIRILLAQIEFLEDLTGEKLEDEDAALVAHIKAFYPASAAEVSVEDYSKVASGYNSPPPLIAEDTATQKNVRTSVSREEAIEFLNVAARNWDHIAPLSEDDIGDVATALLWFANKRPAATEGSDNGN